MGSITKMKGGKNEKEGNMRVISIVAGFIIVLMSGSIYLQPKSVLRVGWEWMQLPWTLPIKLNFRSGSVISQ